MVDLEQAGFDWRKSSSSESGACVEVGKDPSSGLVAVRHSQWPAGPSLAFLPTTWTNFLGNVRRGTSNSSDGATVLTPA